MEKLLKNMYFFLLIFYFLHQFCVCSQNFCKRRQKFDMRTQNFCKRMQTSCQWTQKHWNILPFFPSTNCVGLCLVDLVNFVWNLFIYSFAIPLGVANDYKLHRLTFSFRRKQILFPGQMHFISFETFLEKSMNLF